jgi:hydroxymethylglutaryl-CoA lyase
MAAVDIREVGPRDGLQAQAPIAVEDRVRLIEALIEAGVRHIEACSFVSPKAVPSMAGAAEVMALVPRPPDVRYAALVPNLKGAEMAFAAGVDELTVTVSASATYNQKNVRRTIDESVTQVAEICKAAADTGVPIDAIISFAFGSPYEEVRADDVAGLGRRLVDAGAPQLTYADTNGSATPPSLDQLARATGAIDGLHLHNGRGMALVNAYAAVEMGVRRFDTSVCGLGGSPFADDAGGNLATEEFVYLLGALGHDTGIDLDALSKAGITVAEMLGAPR